MSLPIITLSPRTVYCVKSLRTRLQLFIEDPRDVPANGLPTNDPVHNWIGSFGAWMAYGFLLWFGAAAFVLPVLTLFLGLGCFFEAFAYLRRRWPWLGRVRQWPWSQARRINWPKR